MKQIHIHAEQASVDSLICECSHKKQVYLKTIPMCTKENIALFDLSVTDRSSISSFVQSIEDKPQCRRLPILHKYQTLTKMYPQTEFDFWWIMASLKPKKQIKSKDDHRPFYFLLSNKSKKIWTLLEFKFKIRVSSQNKY